ncbi:hypothetical protein EUX98_g3192 [Antrodiella citrinella]|uniref:BTB domain-containing protein n=1 Tax=Antrodiella citrinella TaxID=2447956 RepID=A0A4V3XIZ0_9APHY|nr:hypothetical protein EUX98_g3192 [Antrodiella citrinella]
MSLTGGTFIDTKFFVFSRRQASGEVGNPLALFANSSLLRAASPHFNAVLSRGGFEENHLVNMDEDYPADRPTRNDQYDYDDDSDLEEEDEDVFATTIEQDTAPPGSSQKPDDIDSILLESKPENDIHSFSFSGAQTSDTVLKTARIGRVIHVSNFAYPTYDINLSSIRGEVAFKPLRSSPKTESSSSSLAMISHNAPSCSPKSLYRLADRYDHGELKELCAQEIQRQLNEQNIIAEIFSEFSWRYPPIRDTQLDYLCNCCNSDMVYGALPALTEQIAQGSLPHCAEVLNLVMTRLMRR